ncbi:Cobalamin B12-binding domain protein [Desulfatibacillum aliphaticivorans]|uniref:Cobalamin B12-binding domain protein n=1 Tax=Desulfatibacillum aliphaticivorans TaxID=218208 RepID=B8FN09_DESAL|nr:cobalamin-dependent protein [Desulfatibacillum aliphaticivorans]ACL05879.1 Cobalamin B12-binding domain protein [Desulfatibacillum aliphaticivorans]
MKTNQEKTYTDLQQAVFGADMDLLAAAFENSPDPRQALEALTRGLDAVRKKLGDYRSSVAEFLLCVDVMRAGLRKIKDACPKDGDMPVVVIGVVRGDVHDLGKNIVAGVLEAYGYRVVDLGRDVAPLEFVEAVEKQGASVLALSAMMSTPLADMARTIEICKNRLPHVKVLVGGAALDQDAAQNMGADGYAESAVGVPGSLKSVMTAGKTRASRVFVDYDKKLRVEELEAASPPEQE